MASSCAALAYRCGRLHRYYPAASSGCRLSSLRALRPACPPSPSPAAAAPLHVLPPWGAAGRGAGGGGGRGGGVGGRGTLVCGARAAGAAGGGGGTTSAAAGGSKQQAQWKHPGVFPAFPIGLWSGLLGSFVGIGGGLVMVPQMIWAYGLRQIQANSTALAGNFATCVAGAVTYGMAGQVNLPVAAVVSITGALSARLGAQLANKMNERTQKLLFGATMLAFAPVIAFKPQIMAFASGAGVTATEVVTQGFLGTGCMPTPGQAAYFAGLGAFVGVASGVIGLGAGTMLTTGLAFAGGMPMKLVLGTSFVAQIGPAISGAWAHHQLGNLQVHLLPGLMAGCLAGSAMSSRVAVNFIPDEWLRNTFAVFLVFLAQGTLRKLPPKLPKLK